jgi:endonuclease-3
LAVRKARQGKPHGEAAEGGARTQGRMAPASRLDRPRSRRRSAGSRPHAEPKGEHHSTPFTLLVAVVLSAQATDAGVNKATPALFALADTPEKMVALGEARCAS